MISAFSSENSFSHDGSDDVCCKLSRAITIVKDWIDLGHLEGAHNVQLSYHLHEHVRFPEGKSTRYRCTYSRSKGWINTVHVKTDMKMVNTS